MQNTRKQIDTLIQRVGEINQQVRILQREQDELLRAIQRIIHEDDTYSLATTTDNTDGESVQNQGDHNKHNAPGVSSDNKNTPATSSIPTTPQRRENKTRQQQDQQQATYTRPTYRVGDLIYIKNHMQHITTPQLQDRAATVTNVTPNTVSFTTYTGTETWRSPYNIRHLTTLEQNQLKTNQFTNTKHN